MTRAEPGATGARCNEVNVTLAPLETAPLLTTPVLQQLFEVATAALAVVDDDGCLHYANPAFRRECRLPATEPLAMHLSDLLAPDELPPGGPGPVSTWTGRPRLRRPNGARLQVSALAEVGDIDLFLIEISRNVPCRVETPAGIDALTGLGDRDALLHRVAVQLEQPGPTTHWCLLCIEVDALQVVSNSLGHLAGDRLLCAFVERIGAILPPGTRLNRVSGEEFACLLSREAGPMNVADQILRSFQLPLEVMGQPIRVSASIGIARARSGYDHAAAVLQDAEIALHRARQAGRGRVLLFDPDMHQEAVAQLSLEMDLQQALAADELRLHYQPIVRLDDAAVLGFEALLRWEHPTRGRLTPGSFLDTAEETGAMLNIGRWVIGEATRQLRAWLDTGAAPEGRQIHVSVNLSPQQLNDPDLLDIIDHHLLLNRIGPGQLRIELTEMAVMQDLVHSAHILRALRDRGLRIHVDDFGTGFSSYAHLHRFPIDALKIDRAFVERLDRAGEGEAVMRSMLGLAGSLGMDAIAEGVETQDQADRLRRLGCSMAQGFLFAPAVSADVARHLIVGGCRPGPM